jgi:glycosyltransferase involved in cell wall biosynthesis
MPLLSVVIITNNEEKNIARCLDSIKDVAEDIVVVDSYSTDRTENICMQYDLHFVKHTWEGYSATKNFANAQAKYDWILSLDADEALSYELRKSILEIKKGKEMITCSFNRLTNYCGRWIKHCGWYPDTKVRIFDRRTARWEGNIHEVLKVDPSVSIVKLKGDCLHYSYYSIPEHIEQTEKFTSLAAKDLFEKGKRVNFLRSFFSPVAAFIRSYFFQLGFLDGYYGFVICRISALSVRMKYRKLKELWR